MKIKKVFNYSCLFLIVLALTLGFSTQAYAVHKGAGGLDCSGCHTMHNSQNGDGTYFTGGSPTNRLLRGASTTSLCLSCHDTGGSQYASYSSTVPAIKNATGDPAAGDFADLGANDTGNNFAIGKGHNESLSAASLPPPGGDNVITTFNCANCHDPHGAPDTSPATNGISRFRNLRLSPTDMGAGTAPTQINASPNAGSIGAGDVYLESSYIYGSTADGVSNIAQWCGTCHDNFYGTTNTNAASPYKRHPTGKPLDTVPAIWTSYNGEATADRFPAEDNIGNTANTGPFGNDSKDEVFCLSCHKAHATANADGLRWDYAGQPQSSTTTSGCQQCHNK